MRPATKACTAERKKRKKTAVQHPHACVRAATSAHPHAIRLRRPLRLPQELLLSRGLKAGDVMQIFLEFDTSGDAVLDLQVLHPPLPSGAPAPPVGCLCPSPSGHLPKQEFRVALDVMGCTLPAEKLRQVFEFFDTDGNMLLDAMEFCQVRLASTSHLPPHASRRTSPHRLPLQLPPNDLLYPTISTDTNRPTHPQP